MSIDIYRSNQQPSDTPPLLAVVTSDGSTVESASALQSPLNQGAAQIIDAHAHINKYKFTKVIT